MRARMPRSSRCSPHENGPEAMDWLARVFGFRERARLVGEDGRLATARWRRGRADHARDSLPALSRPSVTARSARPRRAGPRCPTSSTACYVYVDDVAAHFERARSAGATILSAVEEGGEGKRYRAEDLEGHGWIS